MSTPKKPGTDLAALKARLAKKTGKAPPAPAPAAAPPAAAPPAGAHAGVPAEPPMAEPAAPAADIPAPGQVAAPPPEPAPAPTGDDPFGAGTAAAFDPNEGVIDAGGEIAPRGNKGIVILAALGAALFGVAVGWQAHNITSTKERVEIGKAKGSQMVAEVQQVSDARKTISLKMEDFKKAMATDPKAGGDLLMQTMGETFEKHPQVDALFGWQLGSVHSSGIQRTFDLYEEANGLKLDLGYLAGFISQNTEALKAAGGPTLFGAMAGKNGVTLVAISKFVCNLEEQTPCPQGKEGDAVGFGIHTAIGGEETVVPKGTEENQVVPLLPTGTVYNYAVGLEPAKNAQKVYASLYARVNERLEAMNKAERIALRALENYAEDPTVDAGTAPQPDPGAGGE